MARIVFVQRIFREYPAFMTLAAELKRNGHHAEVIISRTEREVLSSILESRPDLVGFSPTAYDIQWCLKIAAKLKIFGFDIILGGAMITANPKMITHPAIDFVCIGEGELCLRALLDKKDARLDKHYYGTVPNLVYKVRGRTFANPLAPLIEDLDNLAQPDHGLYRKYRQIANSPTSIFTFMRGCKFRCSFCYNHVIQKLYEKNNFIVRRRSPELSIKEIEETILQKTATLKVVRLFDSSLLSDMNWTKTFLRLYRERIGVPFVCFAHPCEINDATARELKNSGCIEMGFSIESGSAAIRNKVLCKGSSEKSIYGAARALRRNHVPYVTFNMLGTPGESWEDILLTIKINRDLTPLIAWASLTQIYRGTDLERIFLKMDGINVNSEPDCGWIIDYKHPNLDMILGVVNAFPFIVRFAKITTWALGLKTVYMRVALFLMSCSSFFMQCARPAITFNEFVKHYLIEKDWGSGYY